jgi:hypothetical protein
VKGGCFVHQIGSYGQNDRTSLRAGLLDPWVDSLGLLARHPVLEPELLEMLMILLFADVDTA